MNTTQKTNSDAELLAQIDADADQPTGPPIDGRTLRAVAEAVERRAAAEDDVAAAVHAARDEGLSWAVIGTALGISRQGARQRYDR